MWQWRRQVLRARNKQPQQILTVALDRCINMEKFERCDRSLQRPLAANGPQCFRVDSCKLRQSTQGCSEHLLVPRMGTKRLVAHTRARAQVKLPSTMRSNMTKSPTANLPRLLSPLHLLAGSHRGVTAMMPATQGWRRRPATARRDPGKSCAHI